MRFPIAPLDKPLVAVFFHAVDEYSNVAFHGTKQTIGRGADCMAYEPYARKYLLGCFGLVF